MKKIAVLGSGTVGQVLSDGFLKHGWDVTRGTREPAKLQEWLAKAGAHAHVATFAEATRGADVVLLAVKGIAAEAVLASAGDLDGKVVIDATNPIAEGPPDHGVLRYFTTLDESLMERLQRQAPKARLVKAFSCVGNALMVNPQLPGGPPTMFICGNDADAKDMVHNILTTFGWEGVDMGGVEGARAIEPLCMLWCIPGLLRNEWAHAFKLLRP